MLSRIVQFVQNDVWRMRLGDLRGKEFVFVKLSRVAILSIRGFIADNCSLRASALTFYTLLSIIPILAMAFGIAKGFGLQHAIEREILAQLKGQEEVATWIINFANSFLENTQGGVIAGIGVAVLFWTVIKVLNNIESSFNAIWKTETQRSAVRKITDYFTIMLIGPILLIIESSITVYITREVNTVVGKVEVLSQVSPIIQFGLKSIPYLATWILFSFVYSVMPNKKVHLLAGLLGGIIAGTLYQVFQFVYIYFQVGVSKYNAIYGSFAALPLFLIWLQTSWLILLYGAEISFAYQNVETYEFEPDTSKISYSAREVLILSITRLLVKRFEKGETSLSAKQISQELDIPITLLRDLLQELLRANVISPTKAVADKDSAWENSELRYQPAFDIGRMTISQVVEMWGENGLSEMHFGHSEEVSKVSATLKDLYQVLANSSENKLLKDI